MSMSCHAIDVDNRAQNLCQYVICVCCRGNNYTMIVTQRQRE